MMFKEIFFATALTFAAAPAFAQSNDTEFEVGQVWTYEGGNEDGTILIGKIDKAPELTIVSVMARNVAVSPELQEAGLPATATIGHVPFEAEALARHVDELVSTGEPVPEGFQRGYDVWAGLLEDGEATYFEVSVPEAVTYLLQTYVAESTEE